MLGPQIEQPSESSAYPPVHTHSDDTPHDDNDFVPEPGMYLCFWINQIFAIWDTPVFLIKILNFVLQLYNQTHI